MLSFHVLCISLSFQKWSPSPDSGPPPFSACQRVERSPLKAQLATRGESPLPSPRRDDRILTASITGIFFCLCASLHTSVIASQLPFLGSSTSLTVSRKRCRVRHAGPLELGQACISIDVHCKLHKQKAMYMHTFADVGKPSRLSHVVSATFHFRHLHECV